MSNFLIFFSLFIISSCGIGHNSKVESSVNNAPLGLSASEIKAEDSAELSFLETYTPNASRFLNDGEEKSFIRDVLNDADYLNRINDLIEDIASNVDDRKVFIRMVKATAWIESTWRHYIPSSTGTYVLLGDSGDSFGIMQINSPAHGVELPNLYDNIKFGVNFLKKILTHSLKNDCPMGSNSGVTSRPFLRRLYAYYNGGRGNRCRKNHPHDDRFLEVYENEPWEQYL